MPILIYEATLHQIYLYMEEAKRKNEDEGGEERERIYLIDNRLVTGEQKSSR